MEGRSLSVELSSSPLVISAPCTPMTISVSFASCVGASAEKAGDAIRTVAKNEANRNPLERLIRRPPVLIKMHYNTKLFKKKLFFRPLGSGFASISAMLTAPVEAGKSHCRRGYSILLSLKHGLQVH